MVHAYAADQTTLFPTINVCIITMLVAFLRSMQIGFYILLEVPAIIRLQHLVKAMLKSGGPTPTLKLQNNVKNRPHIHLLVMSIGL